MFEPQTYVATSEAPATAILPPDNKGRSNGVDWERGAEQGSANLMVRASVWKSRVLTGGVVEVSNNLTTWIHVATIPTIDQRSISFSFDLNMNPMLAYRHVGGSDSYLYWFDGTIPGYTTLTQAGVVSSYLVFDYPYKGDADGSEVLWFYMVGSLCKYRRQSDRFTIEYTFGTAPGGRTKITGVGMSRNWRLHVRFGK